MVTLEYDKALINAIWRVPEVYKQASDDFSAGIIGEVDLARMVSEDTHLKVYLAVWEGDAVGLVHFRRKSPIWSELHGCFLPKCRGKIALTCVREAITEEFLNGLVKLTTIIPSCNKPARVFANCLGMKREGAYTESFMKDEILHDQILYGVTRREWLKGMD